MSGGAGSENRPFSPEVLYSRYMEKYVTPNVLIPGRISNGINAMTQGELRDVERFLDGYESGEQKKDGWAKSQPWYGSYELAKQGDFSEFEKIDPLARHFLASKYMVDMLQNNRNILLKPEDHEAELEIILQEQKHNPLFRLGCSQISHTNYFEDRYSMMGIRYRSTHETDTYKDSRYMMSKVSGNENSVMQNDEMFREYDDRMTEMIMEDTLRPMTETQIKNVYEMTGSAEAAESMIHANVEKQVQMAKMIFLTHIGDTYLTVTTTNEQGEITSTRKEPMKRSVASMMSHCSRAGFVLPSNDDSKVVDQMMGAVLGSNTGKAAGIYGRFAATHSTQNGPTIKEFKELKGVCLRKQYGMDLAIGGLGNPGVKGKDGITQTIKTDGTCGHMYLHVNKGEKGQTSSLLVGFESDAPQKTNQMGHTHTSKAAQESMSSFMGQRADEMGDKYGGRTIDCTMHAAEDLKRMVNDFASHYRALMYQAINELSQNGREASQQMQEPTARQRMEETNRMLSGRLMSQNELRLCLNRAGFSAEDSRTMSEEVAANKRAIEQANPEPGKRSVEQLLRDTQDAVRRRFQGIRERMNPSQQQNPQAEAVERQPEPEPLQALAKMEELKKPGLRTRIRAAFGSKTAKEKLAAYQAMITKKVNSVKMSFSALQLEEREITGDLKKTKRNTKQQVQQKEKKMSDPALHGFGKRGK